jgi:hypothetical protein
MTNTNIARDNARRTILFFMLAAPLSIICCDALRYVLFQYSGYLICSKHGDTSRKGLKCFFIGSIWSTQVLRGWTSIRQKRGFSGLRAEIRILLSLAAIALLIIDAQSIGDSIGKSVDQLIDESNGIYSRNSGIPSTPQESRDLWSEKSGINFTMPSKLSGKGTSPEESRLSAEVAAGVEDQTATPAQNPSMQSVSAPSSLNVSGEWFFELRDSKTRELALALFQSEDAIFGSGTMNDGNATQEVLASGFVEGDKLNLDIVSQKTVNLYRLPLTMNGESMSGDYRAFSTSGDPWAGIAKGIKNPNRS